MNSEEVKALMSTLNNYASGAQHLPAHIAEMLKELRDQLHVDSSAAINEANRARHDQAGPIGIARDHPSHDEGETSQGPSVIDRGSREIETRWAKEAIGLTAVELNEAYAQFEIGRDGCDIPSPYLHRATARLVEVMRRLGLAEYREIDSPIPF